MWSPRAPRRDSDAVELYHLGCEYAQGYAFGEPMSAEAGHRPAQREAGAAAPGFEDCI